MVPISRIALAPLFQGFFKVGTHVDVMSKITPEFPLGDGPKPHVFPIEYFQQLISDLLGELQSFARTA